MDTADDGQVADMEPPAEVEAGDSGAGFSAGAIIRRLRQEKGMSLQQLAVATGVSVGTLSQLERNRINPSVRVLASVRRALGAPIAMFFEEHGEPPSDASFVRRVGSRPTLELGHLRKELLSAGSPHGLQLMIIHLDPGSSSGNSPLSYPAEKGGMLLRGQLVLRVGEEESLLQEGDSFVFDSSNPHGFHNPGPGVTSILWVIGPVPLERHV